MRNRARCNECGLMQYQVAQSTELIAHFWQAYRCWCPGGIPPTKSDISKRKSAKKGRSIWAMRGYIIISQEYVVKGLDGVHFDIVHSGCVS